MARAGTRKGRSAKDLAEVIVAEWFRVLPSETEQAREPWEMDANSLTAAFNEILDEPCVAIVDKKGQPLNIAVPMPPAKTREALLEYLGKNQDFFVGLGTASLFGCGR